MADDPIRWLANVASKKGDLLLNVDPRADGYLRPQQVDALDGWKCFNEPGAGGTEIRYKSQDGALYSIPTKMPVNRLINLPFDMSREAATLLETGEELLVERSDQNF